MEDYLPRREASKKLGVHYNTIYAMAERGELETLMVGKQKMYNVEKYMRDNGVIRKGKMRVCYCRVFNKKQKKDLEIQENKMRVLYPTYEIISDIGSSFDNNRKGLKRIIDYAMKGNLEVLIIEHKERLSRFGYEIIENLIKDYSKGEIHVINKKENTPIEEISKELGLVIDSYGTEINILKKYKKILKKELLGEIESQTQSQEKENVCIDSKDTKIVE
jgi:putative resolvase